MLKQQGIIKYDPVDPSGRVSVFFKVLFMPAKPVSLQEKIFLLWKNGGEKIEEEKYLANEKIGFTDFFG